MAVSNHYSRRSQQVCSNKEFLAEI